ncbi:PREDICTED: lipase member J-like [Nicrophorus vespilloides]|uniref:Lipase n=1 Tax=Nicrophorus vespilloides TaxID=110193 RepID=A0ABM1N3D3_NICVS|nr:PREDICTED: lipase member J-like [Nicrophorus vespilloides]
MNSYNTINKKQPREDCYFNPNVGSNTMFVIQREKFQVESYTVTSEDGYITTLYRIPNNTGKPVFIQHGAVSSSEFFVTQGNNSLAFQLHNRGYDVWLGNNRGSFNSPEHQYLPRNSEEYWNYTLDDLGNYELPAVIDFIVKKTGKKEKIIYVGHSQGTTIGMIYDLLHPKHAKNNLEGFIFLGPVAFTSNLGIPFIKAFFALAKLVAAVGVKHLGSRNEFLTKFCTTNEFKLKACKELIDVGFGKSNQYPPDQLPTLISYSLMGESIKPILQYVQMGNSNNFEAFDYETRGNLIMYNSTKPRQYHLNNINLPVHLFGGLNDNLAPVQNVIKLSKHLGLCCKQLHFSGNIEDKIWFNHVNFLYGKDNTKLYNDIFKAMESLKNENC